MSEQDKDDIHFDFGGLAERLNAKEKNMKEALDEIEAVYEAAQMSNTDDEEDDDDKEVIDLSFLKKLDPGLSEKPASAESANETDSDTDAVMPDAGGESVRLMNTAAPWDDGPEPDSTAQDAVDNEDKTILQQAEEAAESDIQLIDFSKMRKAGHDDAGAAPKIHRTKPQTKVRKQPPGPWTCVCGKHNKYMYCSICGRYWEKGSVQVNTSADDTDS